MGLDSLKRLVLKFFNIGHGRAKYKVIRKRITDAARIDGIHVLQLMTAMFIASVGLNLNSTEMIIGAMLICPLMGSVLALAYSIATVDYESFKNAVIGLIVQVVVCLATSTLYFVITPLHSVTTALESNAGASVWEMFVALAGGFAGALGMSRKEEPPTLLAGVAVATALMPPLCATGYNIVNQGFEVAMLSFHEFLINMVFIAFGAYTVLVALRMPVQLDLNGDGVITHEEEERVFRRTKAVRIRLLFAALLLAVPCVIFSMQVVNKSNGEGGDTLVSNDEFNTKVTDESLRNEHPEVTGYQVGTMYTYDKGDENKAENALDRKTVAMVTLSKEISEDDRKKIENAIRIHVASVDEVMFEISPEAQKEGA